ncbi:hypothetical protein LIER_11912 [Lithospermum erythrorhizon]|uniref:Uncharacterized protein n=1 Tax=Lithospermum erythrorhizon TaxID=34254 RepID=A0AAV3PRQ9_LITER
MDEETGVFLDEVSRDTICIGLAKNREALSLASPAPGPRDLQALHEPLERRSTLLARPLTMRGPTERLSTLGLVEDVGDDPLQPRSSWFGCETPPGSGLPLRPFATGYFSLDKGTLDFLTASTSGSVKTLAAKPLPLHCRGSFPYALWIPNPAHYPHRQNQER